MINGVTGRAVCVTGMHRSGTSFIAGSLRFLGVSLGDPGRMLRPGPDNPKGYFEVQSIMRLDDELLAHLGGAWDQPPVLDPGWERAPGLDPFRARAAEILLETFGPPAAWPAVIAWKDPRVSLLLPFWRTVTPVATTIVVVRDPDEVAASLAVRGYPVGAAQAAGLWLRYFFAARADDPGCLIVRHSDIFDDLPGTVARLARHLDLPAPDARVEAEVREHLDADLRHHDAAVAPPVLDSPLLDLARAVWNRGTVDAGFLPPLVADLIGRGWLASPLDNELLARARAELVTNRETLRKANGKIAKLEARLAGETRA
jgi:O-antigen biosynthesis protein